MYYDATGSALRDDELKEIIRNLEAKAMFSDNIRKLHLRKCWGVKNIDPSTGREEVDTDIIFYDMCSPDWTCLMIDGENETWHLLPYHPDTITFYRYQQTKQETPSKDYPEDIFDQWLTAMHIIDEGDRLLFKIWFVAGFIPNQPHPMLIAHGPPGGAKSTFTKHIQTAMDPYAGEPLILPTEKKELTQQAHHRSVLVYDNVPYDIAKWLSDILCQLVTSANVSKRQLYTDDTDFAYVVMRTVVLNGLYIPRLKPDALDRTIDIHFNRISEEERKNQSEIDAWFREQLPKILGKTFDTLARSLKIYKIMAPLTHKPRMADFASRGASIARAFAELEGKDPDKMVQAFLDAYGNVMERQNIDVVESNPVASAFIRWHDEMLTQGKEGEESVTYHTHGSIRYVPGDLLYKLTLRAQQMGFDTKDREWPKRPNQLTRELGGLINDIKRGYGIIIDIYPDTKGEFTSKNSKIIRISRVSLSSRQSGGNNNNSNNGGSSNNTTTEDSSIEKNKKLGNPSPPSPPSPPGENSRSNSDKKGGDGGGDTPLTISTKNSSNIALFDKRSNSGDSGDGGDTFDKTILFSPQNSNSNSSLSLLSLVKEDSISVDLEWDNRPGMDDRLFQFNFKDHTGKNWVLNAERDCGGSESRLLDLAEDTIRNYKVVLTYYEKGVNLGFGIWDKRCKALGKISPINMGNMYDSKDSYIDLVNRYDNTKILDIDLGIVYEKEIITNFLDNCYLSNELDEVSKSLLGKGKVEGVTGEFIVEAPLEKQIEYGLRDAELTYDLAGARNYSVLSILEEIGNMVGLDLVTMAHTGPTVWWANLFREKMGIPEPLHPPPTLPTPDEKITSAKKEKEKKEEEEKEEMEILKGGDVAQIKEVKEYRNVAIFDFRGQYPSIISKYNISFDTVCCCDCCRDDETAKVRIDSDSKYWICKKKKGALPIAIEKLVSLRDQYKEENKKAVKAGDLELAYEYDIKQLACKLMANSGFGVFGERAFPYGDIKVAQLITGLGRSKVRALKEKVERDYPGLENIYRDTDSAFVIGIENTHDNPIGRTHPTVKRIVNECSAPEGEGGLGLPLEYQKCYSKVMIAAPKNYMGVNADTGKIEVKGMVGKKRNQCKLIRDVFEQQREYWKNDTPDYLAEIQIKSVVKMLDDKTIDIEQLREKITIRHDPFTGYQKSPKHPACVLGRKHNKQRRQSISFFLKDKKNTEEYSFTEDPAEISYDKYRERLKTALKPILTVRGYNDMAINTLLNIPHKKKRERKKTLKS
jgi:DNA polymerase elongation subunit (family B)